VVERMWAASWAWTSASCDLALAISSCEAVSAAVTDDRAGATAGGVGGLGFGVDAGSLLVGVGLGGDVEGLGALGAVAVDGYGLEAEAPGFGVGVGDVLDGAVVGEVDGLADGAGEEGLGGGHHLDVAHVGDGAGSLGGLEGAVEDGEVLGLDGGCAFDGAGGVDVVDDGFDFGSE
jgi:hypothetical protein